MKEHCLSIQQSLLLLAAALTTMIGGCSCFGPDPDSLFGPQCIVSGDYLQFTQVEYCTSPRLIGKSENTTILAVPIAKPVSEENSYLYSVTTKIISVATNGSTELIRELDFLPGTIVSNGDYIAWVTPNADSVMVINRTSPDPWTAVDIPSQLGALLGLAGTRLGMGLTGEIVVVDLADRKRILQVDTDVYADNTPGSATWAISKDWLVTIHDGSTPPYVRLIKRHSLMDSSVTIVTQIGRSNRGYNPVIDSSDNTVYWLDTDPLSDLFNQGTTRLFRWNSTSNLTDIRDPHFIEENHDPPPSNGLVDDRRLMESVNGTLVGEQYDNGSRYFFIRQPDDSEQRVLIESQKVLYPTLVNNHIVWLDTDRRKVVIFDPQSQNTSEVDIPQ